LKNKVAICLGLAVLGVAGATSAQAQPIYAEPPRGYVPIPAPGMMFGLPPHEILRIVRASGLRPLTQPARRGPTYVLLASDNMGGQLRVVIGARNGRILHAAPAQDPRFAYNPGRPRGYVPGPSYGARTEPSYNAPPPDLREPSLPPRRTVRASPPSAGTSQRLASAPDVTGSVPTRPARTPLPRPRPAVASNETAAPVAPPATASTPAETAAPPAAEPPASPPAAATNAVPAKPTETQLVPVAPLD
jgi:hypothetical protein